MVRELVRAGEFGVVSNWMSVRFQRVLGKMFYHRNQDGGFYTPRIMDIVFYRDRERPYYIAIKLDTEALWHFTKEQYASGKVLDALADGVYYPVQVMPFKPGLGVTYIVVLQDMKPAGTLSLGLPKPIAQAQVPTQVDLDLPAFTGQRGKLLVPVGVSAHGPVHMPLPDFGHAMIVGTSGSGKSNWEHAALATLLTWNSPHEVQVALLDPKQMVLSPWEQVPHVWQFDGQTAYGDQPTKSFAILNALVNEMDQRGKRMKARETQNIGDYNAKVMPTERLPYVVVLIDEFGAVKKIPGALDAIEDIATRGLGFGIFLWLTSQYATAVGGLPGLVKAQLSSRIILHLDMAQESKALGCPEAHTISPQAKGRMYARVGSQTATLMQSYFVEPRVSEIARQLRDLGKGEAGRSVPEPPIEMKALLVWSHCNKGDRLTLELVHEWSRETGRGLSQRERNNWMTALERDTWVIRDTQNGNGRKLSTHTLAVIETWSV